MASNSYTTSTTTEKKTNSDFFYSLKKCLCDMIPKNRNHFQNLRVKRKIKIGDIDTETHTCIHVHTHYTQSNTFTLNIVIFDWHIYTNGLKKKTIFNE